MGENGKSTVDKEVIENDTSVLSTSFNKTLQKYPDLAAVVETWPELSEQDRKAILHIAKGQ